MLFECYPSLRGKVEYIELGTPLDTNYHSGSWVPVMGFHHTKGKADVDWLRPQIDELPEGLFVCRMDVTVDGFGCLCTDGHGGD